MKGGFIPLHFFDEKEDFMTLFYQNDNRCTLFFDNGFKSDKKNT